MAKRNHPLYIIKNVITTIKSILIPIIFLFAVNLKNIPSSAIILLALLLFASIGIISYLNWKNNTYQVYDDTLIIEKGILGKSKQAIALDKITTINENQELIERIFNLSTFKIDVGSATKGNEVKLTISHLEAQLLKEQLLKTVKPDSSATGIRKKSNSIRISNKELLKYAVINSNIFLGIIIVLTLIQFMNDIPFIEKWMNTYFDGWTGKISEFGNAHIPIVTWVLFIAILIIVYLFFTILASIIITFIKYYQFTLTQNKDSLIIEYGLIDKKSYTLDSKKITAVYTTYGFFGQFFGISSLKIENIGYGDEKGEVALLFPIISEKNRKNLILSIAPEFYVDGQNKLVPGKKALLSYEIRFTFLPILVAIILTVIFSYGYLSFIGVLLFGILGFIAFQKAGIQFDSESIMFTHGIFEKNYSVLKKKHIQSISISQTPFQIKNGLSNLTYSYQGNIFGKQIGIRGLKKEQIEEAGISSLGLKE